LRRALILTLGGVLLFLAAAGAGMVLASQVAPRELHSAVEKSLSEAFGTPVQVGRVRLRLGAGAALAPGLPVLPSLTVEVDDVVAWPRLEGPAFVARRLDASLDTAALLSRRVRMTGLRIEEARLALVRRKDGSFDPPLLSPKVQNPLRFFERLFAAELPAPRIVVEAGQLSLLDHAAPSPEGRGPERLHFDDVALRLLEPGIIQSGALHLEARLRQEQPGAGARIELDATPPEPGGPPVALAVTDLSLGPLAAWLAGGQAAGRASGVVTIGLLPDSGDDWAEEGVAPRLDLGLDLRLSGLRVELAGAREPLARKVLAGRIQLALRPDSVRLGSARIRSDGLHLDAKGALERPFREGSALSFQLRVPRIAAADVQALLPALPPRAAGALEPALSTLKGGALAELEIDADSTLGRLQRGIDGRVLPLPRGTRLAARLDGLALGSGSERFEDVSGRVRVEAPDTLTVSGLAAVSAGDRLPVLDLRLEGLGALLAAGDDPAGEPAPVPALPGRTVLLERLAGDREPGEERRWRRIEVQADWIRLPLFVRTLRGVRAWFEPVPDGIRARVEEAEWGGVAVVGHGTWTRTEEEHVGLTLTARRPRPRALRRPEAGSWARGRFSVEVDPGPAAAGGGPEAPVLLGARGRIDASGSRLLLREGEVDLAIPGRLGGNLELDLGQAGRLPIDGSIRLSEADGAALTQRLGLRPGTFSGTLDIDARLRGPVAPEGPMLAGLDGEIRMVARDGQLGFELPLLLAIAKASSTFDPFGSARGIRFEEIEADLALEQGMLSTRRTIAIDSPDLRMVLSGSLDTATRPPELALVVGCFFFRPLDTVIGAMPVVSRILLGPDRSLFGTYFDLTGPWDSPEAGLIPMKTVALGPASFLLEDVPAFVARGVRAIQAALPGGSSGTPPAGGSGTPPVGASRTPPVATPGPSGAAAAQPGDGP